MHEKFFVLDNFIERVKNVENAINCLGLSHPQSPGHGHSPDSTLLSAILCVSINCSSGQNNWIMQDIYRKINLILVI